MRLSFIENGTFHSAILSAIHSTIAVFPTQASQTRQGLFFVLRLRTAMSLSISLSLPITASIFPSFASLVISVVKKSRAGVFDSCFFPSCHLLISKGVSHSSPPRADCSPENIFSARFQKSSSIPSFDGSFAWV